MGDGTLRLERQWTALTGTGGAALAGANEPWTIAIDGTAVGALAPKETVEVAVAPGIELFAARLLAAPHLERSFDIAQDEAAGFIATVRDSLATAAGGTRQARSLDHAAPSVSPEFSDLPPRARDRTRQPCPDPGLPNFGGAPLGPPRLVAQHRAALTVALRGFSPGQRRTGWDMSPSPALGSSLGRGRIRQCPGRSGVGLGSAEYC